jgi:hypothetical protein
MSIRTRLGEEEGSALLSALMVTTLLTMVGAVLALTTVTETLISANYRTARGTLYAAEGGLERAMADLRGIADWSVVLTPPPANMVSGFDDGAAAPRGPDGTTLDLARLTASRQADSDARYGPGPNSPMWRLFAHADLSRLHPADIPPAMAYVTVWVADDPAEQDGDPSRDSNGVLMLRAEAFGPLAARSIVEATVKRPAGAVRAVSVVAWRHIR